MGQAFGHALFSSTNGEKKKNSLNKFRGIENFFIDLQLIY